jgi:hypothetical protein
MYQRKIEINGNQQNRLITEIVYKEDFSSKDSEGLAKTSRHDIVA